LLLSCCCWRKNNEGGGAMINWEREREMRMRSLLPMAVCLWLTDETLDWLDCDDDVMAQWRVSKYHVCSSSTYYWIL
jgi:hypothetical protein